MRIHNLLTTCLVLFVCSCAALGQGYGTINGQVKDPTGAAVAGANISVIDTLTGTTRTAVSGTDGFYTIPSMPPATYSLSATSNGFKKFSQSGILLHESQSLTVDLALQLGDVSETVTVNTQVVQVDTTTPTLKEVVDSTRMVEIPLNGRNAAQLTTLVAGAVTAPSNNADQGNAKTFPAAVTVSVNGARENQTGYFLDGVPNNDIFSNINQPFPMPDALHEFSVQTSNYNAEYGQAAGGVVSIATKSGTNKFHGTAFEFLRNRIFNAANYFGYVAQPAPLPPVKTVDPLKRNQFGGTFGGPIIRDKTFFFGGYQGTRIRSVQSGRTSIVPTDINRLGQFPIIAGQPVLKDPDNGNKPFPTVACTNPPGNLCNYIDPSRFDPVSVAILAKVPHALNQTTGQLVYSTPINQDYNEYIARGDHQITANDRFAGRYFYDWFNNIGSYGGNLVAYTLGSLISSHNALLSETHTFSPSLLNDFRFGFIRVVSNRMPPPGAPDIADFGVPIWQPSIKQIQGMSVTSYFSTGALPTAKFPRTSYVVLDDLRWVHDKHSFSVGAMYERDQLNMVNLNGAPGTFNFNGAITGNALTDFFLGRLRTFGQNNGQHVKNRYWEFNVYAQDSYRLNQKLTLSFGVRYEPSRVWHDQYLQNQLFLPQNIASGTRSMRFPNAPAGLVFSGDPGVPLDGTRGDYKNVAPRVGFAYDVYGNGKTSIRGGLGVFYDSRVPALSNNRMLGAAPFSATVSLTNPVGHFSNPYQGVPNPFPAVFPPDSSATFVTPVTIYSWDPVNPFITPRVYMLNLAGEQDLGHGLLGRVAYVGARSQHLTTTLLLNSSVYIPFQTGSTTSACTLSPDQRRVYNNPAGTCTNSNPPATPFSQIYQQSNSGNAWYHSAQFTISKPLSHGLTVLANYTFSKSLDNMPYGTDAATFATSGYYVLPTTAPGFRRYDTGLSDFDHRHVFVNSYVWNGLGLEKSNALLRRVAGGWQLSGVFKAQSGQPLNLAAGSDVSLTTIGLDRPQYSGTGGYAASGTCTPTSLTGCKQYLTKSAFTLPATGQFGNVGKGQFIGPGFWSFDTGVFKNMSVSDRYSVQFRGELFNVFNHTQFNGPVASNPNSVSFGQIQSAGDPRIIQLALKVVF